MRHRRPHIVGLGGTLRDGSTSERALQLALAAAAEMDATTEIFAPVATAQPSLVTAVSPSGMKNGTRFETLPLPPAKTEIVVEPSLTVIAPGEVLVGVASKPAR